MIKKTVGAAAVFLSLILSAAITVSTFSVSATGWEWNDSNAPEFYTVGGVVISVNFGEPNAFISVTIGGYHSTTYKDGKITLERFDGGRAVTVKEWTGLSASGYVFQFSDGSVTASPGSYRLSVSVTTRRGDISEVVSGYIDLTHDGTSKWQEFNFGLGDLDQSGALGAVDLTVLMKIIAGKKDPVGFQSWLADINRDGAINAKDLTVLMKVIARGG